MAFGGDKELRVADGRLLGPLETSPAILPWFFLGRDQKFSFIYNYFKSFCAISDYKI